MGWIAADPDILPTPDNSRLPLRAIMPFPQRQHESGNLIWLALD